MPVSRRDLLLTASAAGVLAQLPFKAAYAASTTTHGLSSFGDLALPADFKHFPYVNPNAPKGGQLTLQITSTGGNQAFDTFNTLNIFAFRGQGAAGMGMVYDSLMSSSSDEPDSAYGLVAQSVSISNDKNTFRFRLRPEARFHDGSELTAEDVAFSLNTLKNDEQVYPTYRLILKDMVSAEAEAKHILKVTLSPQRARDLHLTVAAMPIFSKAYYTGREFGAASLEAPLTSGAYKVSRFEQGRFIEFERVTDYWGKDLPVNVGLNNFDRIRYEYFRDRQVAFEAFKGGILSYQAEYTSRIWATGYDFPAIKDGRVLRDSIETEAPVSAQGWRFNLRRDKFKDARIREAIGLAFDFEWTNATIMYGSYQRVTSYFENSVMKAKGKPSPEELALLEPFRKDITESVFDEAYLPPVSDGSGQDRNLLRRADQLLMEAGCTRKGRSLLLPDGSAFEIEFLDFQPTLQPHTQPFIANLGRLGINARSRIVDASQYQQRLNSFDFDIISLNAGGSLTPGDSLRLVYGSQAAKTPSSLNYCGISNPAIDAMIEHISAAKSREELNIACRALDRILRAEKYWVPMWYNNKSWVAWWNMYSRPDKRPRFDTGAPMTWWYDAEKAKKIGKG
ncbi:extracellular solute-binding protein [Microvirga sp. W0021]|uniref:Extracellular solute-binding protein n=1 Tax=Hohaiivirga grylli TaxID=3133970 RepID=A0ABV0BJX5_9HYPH